MPNISCTRKLESLIPVQPRHEATPGFAEWHGHLTFIDGKKSLLFVEKQTLYAVMMPGVRKEHVPTMGRLFFQAFRAQLTADRILPFAEGGDACAEQEAQLEHLFGSVTFWETDGDQKALAVIRDIGQRFNLHLQFDEERSRNKAHYTSFFMANRLNHNPWISRAFKDSRELMAVFIVALQQGKPEKAD